VTARLPHNPRVLLAPGHPALAAEIRRFAADGPAVGDWFFKLEAIPARDASAMADQVLRHGGGALTRERCQGHCDALVRVPGDAFGVFLTALGEAGVGQGVIHALHAAAEAWQRTRFTLRCGSATLEIGQRTLVMGIVNVTPDSFSDGGQFLHPARAIEHGLALAEAGADILDIGGESTRPGSEPVDAETECARVLPVIAALARQATVPVSIDTSKAIVARRALDAGAAILNDVTALRGDPGMAAAAADSGAPLVLMHMRGTPRTMQQAPHYDDLMGEVTGYLRKAMARAVAAGVSEEQIVVDPGLGFGKTLGHNLELVRRLGELRSLGRPILVGPSRKSMIGQVLGVPAHQRLHGTAALVALAVARGAHIVRVHDVAAMSHVARMADAVVEAEKS